MIIFGGCWYLKIVLCFLLCFHLLSALIIGKSIYIELERESLVLSRSQLGSIYKEDKDTLFLFNKNSSFYSTYSVSNNNRLIMRKLGHFVGFGILASIIFAIAPFSKTWLKGVYSVALATFIGLSDEVHQYFLLNRSGRLFDVLIDFMGALFFCLYYYTIYRNF